MADKCRASGIDEKNTAEERKKIPPLSGIFLLRGRNWFGKVRYGERKEESHREPYSFNRLRARIGKRDLRKREKGTSSSSSGELL